MIISRSIELDYGHTLPNHYSFCNQIHGHRAKVVSYVQGEVDNQINNSSQGMVLDFKILKQLMMSEIHDVLDHGFAVWIDDEDDLKFIVKRNKKYLLTGEPPTAEYLAKWGFNQLYSKLPKEIILQSLEWYETPTSVAKYSLEDKLKDNNFFQPLINIYGVKE